MVMKFSRSKAISVVALLACTISQPAAAQAVKGGADYPNRPVRLVVSAAPGGSSDGAARVIGQRLGEKWGQQIVIDNRGGAGGILGAGTVAQALPDGYTIGIVALRFAVNPSLLKVPFDTVKDFAPGAQLATFNLALYVADSSPFKTLADVLAYARANPGKLNVGTPQVGTTQNLAAELFRAAAGIDFQVVPFNGTPPVINALRGGQLDVGVDILGPLMGQINGKAIRAIALMGDRREPLLPEVPTVREAGGTLASFNATSWNGLAVPAKTPPAVIARLNSVINTALQQPEVKNKLAELTLNAQGSTPEQLAQRLAADVRKWAEVIERAKIPKQ